MTVLLNNNFFSTENRNEITPQNLMKLNKTLGYVTNHFSSLTKCTAATFSSTEMCCEHENFLRGWLWF